LSGPQLLCFGIREYEYGLAVLRLFRFMLLMKKSNKLLPVRWTRKGRQRIEA
jgi:hypothetical protein